MIKGQPDAKEMLLSQSQDSLFSITIAGMLLKDMPGDAEIIEELSQKSIKVVFSDECQTAFYDAHFFKSFFARIGEADLLGKIISSAQIVSRRQASYVKNVALLAEQLSFNLSAEAGKQLIVEVLTSDSLLKTDDDVKRLLRAVCSKLGDDSVAEFENLVIRSFVQSASSEANANMSIGFETKVIAASNVFHCIDALGTRVSIELVNEVIAAFIKMLFLEQKEDAEIDEVITRVFCSKRVRSESDATWALIDANTTKIQTSTHANFIKSVVPLDKDQLKNSVSEAALRTLLQQNFQSAVNYRLMLGLMGLLSRLDSFVTAFKAQDQIS